MDRKRIIALLLLCYALLAVLRLTAPYDIDDRDQAKQGLYVLDVVQGVSFFLPTEHGAKPATKPSLYTWAAAGVSLMRGDVTDFTIKLPAVLCGFAVVIVTFLLGETLFSKEVGLFAGLVLILNYHFTNLSCTARTDMMLTLFISLALYFFLVAYRQGGQKSVYNILVFVAMGLGSITKGPVAFLVPVLAILTFLAFKRDLKRLRSMQLGWGMLIWMAIMLGWFIPAIIEGGQRFWETVIRDEMVNRVFAIGTRAGKTRPFYYLVGHFLGKFLPWSLVVPLALIRYGKSRNAEEKGRLLFPVVWFLTVLVFFSLSKGKRSDYILPLYPAASLIVAHFWVSLIGRDEDGRWRFSLRALSLIYLVVSFVGAAGLLMFLSGQQLPRALVRIAPESAERIELLQSAINSRAYLLLATAIPFATVSILGVVLAVRRNLKALLVVMLAATGLSLSLYFEVLSPEATRMDGERKRAFCATVKGMIDATEDLEFYNVDNSILFYMGKNVQPLNHDEATQFLRVTGTPYLITAEADYRALGEPPDFPFPILVESDYLVKTKGGKTVRYVLLGKKKFDN